MPGPLEDQFITGSVGIEAPLWNGESDLRPGKITIVLDGAAGIPSAEAFGSGDVLPDAVQVFGDAGIASLLAFGVGGSVTFDDPPGAVGVTGIESALAFGSNGRVFDPDGDQMIVGLVGIPSGEAFTEGPAGVRIDPFTIPRAMFVAF